MFLKVLLLLKSTAIWRSTNQKEKMKLLTNEDIINTFDNKFLLALHMIDIAHGYINAGEEVTLGRLMAEMKKQIQLRKDEK
jgi:hypothetical protein